MMNGFPLAPESTRPLVPPAIAAGHVIAIGRHLDPATVPSIGEALLAGGIHAFEVTLNSASALSCISALADRFGLDDLLIGAGTVLDLDQARSAVDAGATFLVMPHTDLAIIEWAARRHLPVFPGAFSPTEILAGWRAGAAAIKLFPASAVGPHFVRELRGPLPEVPLIPTGGITLENAPAFISAGALAVGMGSWLMGGGDAGVIRERAIAITTALAASDRQEYAGSEGADLGVRAR
jgi:2-dehydro-3-deoxyphosphogluconate aldolase / (4S)-4-hydroxy-2-oxoglutarate aldolase